jgi:low affinity Fe/Cu permease
MFAAVGSVTSMAGRQPIMPSEVSDDIGRFDRFASAASRVSSRAYFFVACVLLVLIWAPSYFLFGNVDTWQLLINTATTIITFLMVALLQNSQTRADQAVQHKLNAIADALGDLMEHLATGTDERDLMNDRTELKRAVGLESHESTTRNTTASRSSGISR